MAEKNIKRRLSYIDKKYLWTEYDGEDYDPDEGLTPEEIDAKQKALEEKYKDGFDYFRRILQKGKEDSHQ